MEGDQGLKHRTTYGSDKHTPHASYFIARDILYKYIVASELKDPICHSNECQIGSFSSEATICPASEIILQGDKSAAG